MYSPSPPPPPRESQACLVVMMVKRRPPERAESACPSALWFSLGLISKPSSFISLHVKRGTCARLVLFLTTSQCLRSSRLTYQPAPLPGSKRWPPSSPPCVPARHPLAVPLKPGSPFPVMALFLPETLPQSRLPTRPHLPSPSLPSLFPACSFLPALRKSLPAVL